MSNKYQDWSKEDLQHEAKLINEVLSDIKARERITQKHGGVHI